MYSRPDSAVRLDVLVAQVLGDGQELGGAAAQVIHLVCSEDDRLMGDGLLDGAGHLRTALAQRPAAGLVGPPALSGLRGRVAGLTGRRLRFTLECVRRQHPF
jgi:hypothetical protein